MVFLSHRLFDTQYFHGTDQQAELGIRAWALIHNESTFYGGNDLENIMAGTVLLNV
jgi:hypothetical protein